LALKGKTTSFGYVGGKNLGKRALSLISLFYFVLYINMFIDEAAYAELAKGQ
jgi:hypothetical protein